MILVYILIFITAAYTYMLFETTWLKIERLNLSKKDAGLHVMHMADLHVHMTGISAARIRREVVAENPDVILISGDYIDRPVHAAGFLKYLNAICKGYRTIICLGNHDIKAFGGNKAGLSNFVREIEALEVDVLRNRTVVLEKNGKKYNIIGIDDMRCGKPDVEKAMAGCVPDAPKIAVTHNPDIVLKMPGKIVDYLLAGHFHGGQIWLPFKLEFLMVRDDQLCKMGLNRGLARVNGIKVYLNRGLGNVVVPLRFLSRPEIMICTIP